MALALFVVAAALLAYRMLWSHLHELHGWSGVEARSLRGRIIGGEVGRLVLQPEDGPALELSTAGARVIAWPAPGALRLSTTLRVGDPVAVLALPDGDRLCALRIVRGAWPAPPLRRLPSAVVGVVCGVAMLQVLGSPVTVRHQVEPPCPAPFLLDAPDPVKVHAAARRMGRIHLWSGAGDASSRTGTGQSFLDYVGARPNLADRKRRYLYLQPVGSFDGRQAHLLRLTTRFLALFYGLPVRVAESLPLSEVPDHARRLHPDWGNEQLLTTYLLHDLFRWRRPADAAGFLGITGVDIWPGEGWEAVYGQASPVERVGVLSIYRQGDLDGGPGSFRQALLRTLKVAAHETGHIFSMQHCINRGCLMSGHNDREEADARYPVLCPECLAKLVWATRCAPVQRYASLASFCREHQLNDEATLYSRLMAVAAEVWHQPQQDRLALSY